MKKIFLTLSILLFITTISFAQAWTVKVTWDPSSSNCDCETSIGSYYKVDLVIVDVANDNTIVYTSYNNTVNVPTEEKVFDVETEVKDHCDDINLTNIPNYTIFASVTFYCADTTPPEELCSGNNNETNVSCLDFSNDQQLVDVILN